MCDFWQLATLIGIAIFSSINQIEISYITDSNKIKHPYLCTKKLTIKEMESVVKTLCFCYSNGIDLNYFSGQNEILDSKKLDIFVNIVTKHVSSFPVEQMTDKKLDELSNLKSHWLGVLKKILPFIRSRKRGSQVISYILAKK